MTRIKFKGEKQGEICVPNKCLNEFPVNDFFEINYIYEHLIIQLPPTVTTWAVLCTTLWIKAKLGLFNVFIKIQIKPERIQEELIIIIMAWLCI